MVMHWHFYYYPILDTSMNNLNPVLVHAIRYAGQHAIFLFISVTMLVHRSNGQTRTYVSILIKTSGRTIAVVSDTAGAKRMKYTHTSNEHFIHSEHTQHSSSNQPSDSICSMARFALPHPLSNATYTHSREAGRLHRTRPNKTAKKGGRYEKKPNNIPWMVRGLLSSRVVSAGGHCSRCGNARSTFEWVCVCMLFAASHRRITATYNRCTYVGCLVAASWIAATHRCVCVFFSISTTVSGSVLKLFCVRAVLFASYIISVARASFCRTLSIFQFIPVRTTFRVGEKTSTARMVSVCVNHAHCSTFADAELRLSIRIRDRTDRITLLLCENAHFHETWNHLFEPHLFILRFERYSMLQKNVPSATIVVLFLYNGMQYKLGMMTSSERRQWRFQRRTATLPIGGCQTDIDERDRVGNGFCWPTKLWCFLCSTCTHDFNVKYASVVRVDDADLIDDWIVLGDVDAR